MPLPAIIPAAVGAVGSWIGSWFSGNKQDSINEQQQQFAREMYDRQRADNLADWNSQNDYNSPSSQMARLRAAGLNPNMVYGNGSAVQTAGPIRGADKPQWTPQAKSFDPGAGIQAGLHNYMDITQREAQTDNLKAQNTILLQDALLKQAQTNKTNVDTARGQLELNRGTDLYETSLEMYKEQLRKLTNDADDSYNRERISENNAYISSRTFNSEIELRNLRPREAEAKIAATVAQTKNAQLQSEFKELENSLKRNGLSSSDPFYFRVIGQLFSKYGITIK